MFRKPNDVFASNKRLAAADFPRHWKVVFLQLFCLILIIALFGYMVYSSLEQTKPYLTKDLRLLSQVLRLEMKEKLGNGDTEQQKANNISNISEGLLGNLRTTLYFICIAYGGKVLARATPPQAPGDLSAEYLCDENTIRNHVGSPGDQGKKFYNVSARKSGNLNIPPTLHSVDDEDGGGFHLWVVKILQPEQESPTYYFVRNNLAYIVLILGAIVLPTYVGVFRLLGKSLQE